MQTIEWKAHAPHLLRGVSRVTGHQHRLLWHRLKGLGAPSIIGRCAHQTHLWFDINNYFFLFSLSSHELHGRTSKFKPTPSKNKFIFGPYIFFYYFLF